MTAATGPSPRSHAPSRVGIAVVCAAVLAIAGLVVFRWGSERTDTRVLTGTAHVGADEVSVEVNGWWYGFTPSAVTWYDAHGVEHSGGTPPCLQKVGRPAAIQFGAVPVDGMNGDTWRQVTWVRCLA